MVRALLLDQFSIQRRQNKCCVNVIWPIRKSEAGRRAVPNKATIRVHLIYATIERSTKAKEQTDFSLDCVNKF